MRTGTKLDKRCRKCGRAFKNMGNLAKHLNNHREADAAYRKWQREERGWELRDAL